MSWFSLLFLALNFILPTIITLLVMSYIHYKLLMIGIRLIVFPGSFKPYKLQIENHMGKVLSKKSLELMKVLKKDFKKLLQKQKKDINVLTVLEEDSDDELGTQSKECLEMVAHSIKVLRGLQKKNELNRSQKALLLVQIELIHMMKNTYVNKVVNENTLVIGKEIVQEGRSVYQYLERKNEEGNEIYNSFGDESEMRVEEQEGLWILEGIERVINEYMQMIGRPSLTLKHTESIGDLNYMRAELEDKYNTKEIIIEGRIRGMLFEGGEQCVVFCQPNGGYYEQMHYQSNWIEIYQKIGVSLMIWNYSGYGGSKGTPSPKGIIKDAQLIITYLRNTQSFQNIGVHGESLGGMVASFLGYQMQLPFIVADRTFSSLGEVIHQQKYIRLLLSLITDWDLNTADAFHKAKGYKVLLYDPNDEIIGYFGSLKEGIVRKTIMKLSKIPRLERGMVEQSQWLQRVYGSFQKRMGQIRECGPAYQKQYELLHVVSYQHCEQLYYALSRMYSTLSQLITVFSNHSEQSQVIQQEVTSPVVEQQEQDDNSLDTLNNHSQFQVDHLPDYSHLVSSTHLNHHLFIAFAKQVYDALEQLDAAGLRFSAIFMNELNQDRQHYLIKSFIMNIYVWGSYYPLKSALLQQMTHSEHILYSIQKMKELENELERIMNQEKRRKRNQIDDEVFDKMMIDIEIIRKEIQLIRQKQDEKINRDKQKDSNQLSLSTMENKSMLFSMETENMPIQKNDLEMMKKENKKQKLGHLIPLSCGHNGNMNQTQFQLLLMHIRRANFID